MSHSEQEEMKKEAWTIAFNKRHPDEFNGDNFMLEGYIEGCEDTELNVFTEGELCEIQQALGLRRMTIINTNDFSNGSNPLLKRTSELYAKVINLLKAKRDKK